MYVNSVQDVDLAEMKSNWSLWQKVVELQVEVGSKTSFTASLPIPVTASNVLFEYHTINLTKPLDGHYNKKHAYGSYGASSLQKPPEVQESSSNDLDSVLALLPKDVSAKLTLSGA